MVICPEVVGVFGVFMKGDGDMSNINFTGLSKVAKDVGTVAVGGVGATIASGGGAAAIGTIVTTAAPIVIPIAGCVAVGAAIGTGIAALIDAQENKK